VGAVDVGVGIMGAAIALVLSHVMID